MGRISLVTFLLRSCAAILPILMAGVPDMTRAAEVAQVSISGQDVNGHSVAVNGKGHYTVVMYTNPDLEDASRKMTLALDPYRSRSDFTLVRVVDLRGNVTCSFPGAITIATAICIWK